jgi:DNA repair exonuclease SbcCD nuclease subunit
MILNLIVDGNHDGEKRMSKLLLLPLVCSIGLFGSSLYQGSTLATVVISGAVIKTSHIETTKKYPRKNCPVCKGKGWYLSGDTIKKVDCGYCEPEQATSIMLK